MNHVNIQEQHICPQCGSGENSRVTAATLFSRNKPYLDPILEETVFPPWDNEGPQCFMHLATNSLSIAHQGMQFKMEPLS
jgi:hypothetical protein